MQKDVRPGMAKTKPLKKQTGPKVVVAVVVASPAYPPWRYAEPEGKIKKRSVNHV